MFQCAPYVPILRWKEAERKALMDLSDDDRLRLIPGHFGPFDDADFRRHAVLFHVEVDTLRAILGALLGSTAVAARCASALDAARCGEELRRL